MCRLSRDWSMCRLSRNWSVDRLRTGWFMCNWQSTDWFMCRLSTDWFMLLGPGRTQVNWPAHKLMDTNTHCVTLTEHPQFPAGFTFRVTHGTPSQAGQHHSLAVAAENILNWDSVQIFWKPFFLFCFLFFVHGFWLNQGKNAETGTQRYLRTWNNYISNSRCSCNVPPTTVSGGKWFGMQCVCLVCCKIPILTEIPLRARVHVFSWSPH